jgi:hypothetical protein
MARYACCSLAMKRSGMVPIRSTCEASGHRRLYAGRWRFQSIGRRDVFCRCGNDHFCRSQYPPGDCQESHDQCRTAAAHFVDLLPRCELAPEATDGREPFLHPYQIQGNVASAEVTLLLRSFDTPELARLADQLRHWSQLTMEAFPGLVSK